MVTSQYTFPEIKALHEEAKKKGILLLNELGLDPGIDHLATIKVRDEVHAKGGKYTLKLIIGLSNMNHGVEEYLVPNSVTIL